MSELSEHRPTPSGRPVRILFHINDFGRGGTETALIAWLSALDRRLFAPGLAVTFATRDLDYWRVHSLPTDVPIHVLASPRMTRLHQVQQERKLGLSEKLLHKVSTYAAIRPLVARRFLRLARDYDIVCDFDLTFRRIAGRGSVPWFGVSHYSFSARWGDKKRTYVSRRLAQLARYAAIAVITPAMRREAEPLFANLPVKVVDLPNVFDVTEIRRRASAQATLPSAPFIVSLARLDEGQKDHTTLLKAYAVLLARSPGIGDLVLLGDGPDRSALEALAVQLGIERAVTFFGYCSNPFPMIKAARLLVLSSHYEGCPMVLSEAMALGTPVVSTDCPTGPHDLLDGGNAGLLVAPGDVNGLADAIETLVSDPVLREEVTRHGAEKVSTFSPERANARMLALVAEIAPASLVARAIAAESAGEADVAASATAGGLRS